MVHYFNFIVFYINFEFSPITPGVVAPHIEIEPVDVGEGGDGQEVAQYAEEVAQQAEQVNQHIPEQKR